MRSRGSGWSRLEKDSPRKVTVPKVAPDQGTGRMSSGRGCLRQGSLAVMASPDMPTPDRLGGFCMYMGQHDRVALLLAPLGCPPEEQS